MGYLILFFKFYLLIAMTCLIYTLKRFSHYHLKRVTSCICGITYSRFNQIYFRLKFTNSVSYSPLRSKVPRQTTKCSKIMINNLADLNLYNLSRTVAFTDEKILFKYLTEKNFKKYTTIINYTCYHFSAFLYHGNVGGGIQVL